MKNLFLFINLLIFLTAEAKEVYGVILAGGSGKRLWPLSRMKKPKQFIPLHANKTLLESTIDRIAPLANKEKLWVVTTQEHVPLVNKHSNNKIDKIVSEPDSRNTGPALLLTILEVYKESPDAVIFFVPADHYISDNALFRSSMVTAINYASKSDSIVLLGIQPHKPSTEYGYIQYSSEQAEQVFKVQRFHEKPNAETAAQYIAEDTMLWNTGIFCAKASVFLNEFIKYAPDLVNNMNRALSNEFSYSDLPNEPFDKLVLEKSESCVVVPSCFKWSDVGNLEQFIIAKHDKIECDKVVTHNSSNNIVDSPHKLTVLIDIHDLCVIDTEDVLLISRKNQTDKVKDIITHLQLNGFTRYVE